MTHGNVLALSDSKPFDICLMQRFCKFCISIEKHRAKLMKAGVKMALANPFSVFSNNSSNVNSCYGAICNAVKQSKDNLYSNIFQKLQCAIAVFYIK